MKLYLLKSVFFKKYQVVLIPCSNKYNLKTNYIKYIVLN